MNEIKEKIKKNKILEISLLLFYWMGFVVMYDIFCYYTGLKDFSLNVNTIKQIFVIDVFFGIVYTYLGNYIMLSFLGNEKEQKEYLISSIFLTMFSLIMVNISNNALTNIMMTILYFLYFYCKNPKNKTIANISKKIIIILLIQLIFSFIKYNINNVLLCDLNNDLIKFMLGLDYYIFMLILICIKNKILRGGE